MPSGSRLLLLNTDLLRGGTPTVVRELAVRLRADGIDVEVACLAKWGPVAEELRDAGVPTTALNAAGPRDVAVVVRLLRLVRERRPTTVLSFLMHANAAAAIASLRVGRGVRWVQSIQTTQPNPRWHWPVQRLAARAADAVVVPSPSAAAVARDWAGVPGERVVVIPNAIDPDDWPASPDHDPTSIVFLGRLDPIKDVPTLVAAVALLNDRAGACRPGPGRRGSALLHLHIYGDGPDRTQVARAIADHQLADHVTLHGTIARPQDALASAGVLVLPSLAEGFGLVLIEAMAAGVPVVATDVAGVRDVVRDGVTGLLVPPGSPAALAAAIGRILNDRPLRDRLTAAAAADVRRRFTWGSVLPSYRRVLEV
jgi:glycosyltransferase involved in cell wall biosynthesis